MYRIQLPSQLTANSKYEHVSTVLRSLLLLVFKVLNGLGPRYLSEMLRPYLPNRDLRSSKKKLLIVPKYNLKNIWISSILS